MSDSTKMTPDLETYRQQLLALRAELVGDSAKLRRDALGAGEEQIGTHLADNATDTQDQEFHLARLSSSSETLQAIDEALERIEAGTFGICEDCDEPIPARRLSRMPYATVCVPCKQKREEG